MTERKKTMKKRLLKLTIAGTVLSLLLSACGSSREAGRSVPYEPAAAYGDYAAGSESYMSDSLYAAKATSADMEEADWEEPVEESFETSQAETPRDTTRKLITTMNISAETDDMDALLAHVDSRVSSLGGYIESSDISNGSYRSYSDKRTRYRYANLTIRIPAGNLSEFINDVQENTNITNQSKNIEDVTLTYTDLESHKRMLKTEEERLLDFMEQAETIEDMIAVESRLTEVQYQLDSMESQLRTYDNRINYSTVYLNIEEVVEFTVTEEPKSMWEEIGTGFTESFDTVKEGLRDFFVWFVSHLPEIVMWVIVLFLIVKIAQIFWRLAWRRRAERTGGNPLTPGEERRRRREEEKWQRKRKKIHEKDAKRAKMEQEKALLEGKIPLPSRTGDPIPQSETDENTEQSETDEQQKETPAGEAEGADKT